MKNFLIPFFSCLVLISTSLSTFSCDRTEDEPTIDVTADEAADLVGAALMAGSEGVAAEAADIAYIADKSVEKGVFPLECGETADSLFTRSYTGSQVTATYENHLTWGLNCKNFNIPQSISYSRNMQGRYETARVRSEDSAATDWLVENLLTGEHFILNGNYARTGTQSSKVRNMRTLTSSILVDIDNLHIDKGTQRISTGTGTFTLTGTVDGTSNTFSFAGNIAFNGNGTATLTINGQSYVIDLN